MPARTSTQPPKHKGTHAGMYQEESVYDSDLPVFFSSWEGLAYLLVAHDFQATRRRMMEDHSRALRTISQTWTHLLGSLEQKLVESEGHTLAESHLRTIPLHQTPELPWSTAVMDDQEAAIRSYG